MNGCWLYTGPDDGSAYPPAYDDHLDTSGSPWPKSRYCLSIVTSDAYLFSSLPCARIQGAAREAGFVGSEPYGCNYDPALEGQHAIRVLGNNNLINLSHIAAEFCYGDGVYIAQGSAGTWIIGRNLGAPVSQGRGGTLSGALWYPDMAAYPGIHHTARHGVATSCATGLLIHGLSVWHNGRATFDLEPNGASDVVDSVQISQTETGLHRLLWLAAAGLRTVCNVTVVDNICHDRISIDTRDSYATARHANWSIVRNQGGLVFGSPNDCFELDRIDALEIRDNYQLVDGRRTSMGIDIGTSTGVTVSPSEALQFPVA